MTWVKIDDQFAEHPKIIGLSDAAFRLHVRALCYAARNLTDGMIPAAWVIKSQTKAAVQLVFRGVWDALDSGDYQIHDYLTYQQSRAHVQEQRSQAVNRMTLARSQHVRANKDGTGDEVPEKFAQPRIDPDKKEIQKEPDTTTSNPSAGPPSQPSPLVMSPAEYARLQRHNSFVGSRFQVPNILHGEFRRALGGENPEQVLQDWYLTLNDAAEESGESIPDVFLWLRPQFKSFAKVLAAGVKAEQTSASAEAIQELKEAGQRRWDEKRKREAQQ